MSRHFRPLLVALLATATIVLPGARLSAQTISSAANQVFVVNDPVTTASPITITESASNPRSFKAAKDIRIHIPATFNMVWDVSVTAVTITGSGSGNVSTTLLAYEDGNKTAVIDVTTNFGLSDQIVVSGLKFTSFTAVSRRATSGSRAATTIL